MKDASEIKLEKTQLEKKIEELIDIFLENNPSVVFQDITILPITTIGRPIMKDRVKIILTI